MKIIDKHKIMNLSEYFSRNRGSQAEIARKAGIAQAFLSNIAKGKRTMPAAYCLKIESLTGGLVARKDLRPKDYHLIWPELAERKEDEKR